MLAYFSVVSDGRKLRGVGHIPGGDNCAPGGVENVPEEDNNALCGGGLIPENCAKYPCLILMHGLTGNRNERMLVNISRKLEENRVASLRFDFNGHGESEGRPEDVTVASEVDNLWDIYQFAKGLPFVDPDQIYVGGHSVGGLDAVLLAAEHPDEVKKLVLISPALTTYHELAELLYGDMLTEVLENHRVPLGSFNVGQAMLEETAKINGFETASHIQPEALLIHGRMDRDTPAYNSVMLKKIWGERAALRLIEGADHCYQSDEANRLLSDSIAEYIVNRRKL